MIPRMLAVALAVFTTLATAGVGPVRAAGPMTTVTCEGKTIRIDWGSVSNYFQILEVELKKAKVTGLGGSTLGYVGISEDLILAFKVQPLTDEVTKRPLDATWLETRAGLYNADGDMVASDGSIILSPSPEAPARQKYLERAFSAIKTPTGYKLVFDSPGSHPRICWYLFMLDKRQIPELALIRLGTRPFLYWEDPDDY